MVLSAKKNPRRIVIIITSSCFSSPTSPPPSMYPAIFALWLVMIPSKQVIASAALPITSTDYGNEDSPASSASS